MERLCVAEKAVELFPSEKTGAPLIVVNGEDGEGEALYQAVKAVAEGDFSLVAIGGLDWDDDLTPWPAPGAFRGQSFGGHADKWLEALTGQVLPAALERLPERPRWIGLAGYSLAGLFAAWAACRVDAFQRFASVSGSLWYPGFIDWAAANAPARAPERVYISVGDKEGRARNPVMRTVEDAARHLVAVYEERNVPTRFELNPGGHFNDPLGRMAKGIGWLLDN